MLDPQKAIDALVAKGKISGRLTHDQIIEALSTIDIGPDQFDEILERFTAEGIEVVDDDEFLNGTESAPLEGAGRIEFDASARELLKWATWIALCRDAPEVDSSHLIAASQAESPPPEPGKIWDIPFSTQMQWGLARACAGTPPIDRNHILKAFGLRFTASEALGEKVRHLLRERGVNTSDLWRQLEDFEAYDCFPKPEFNRSDVGRRWQSIASEGADQPLGRELGFLLFCILADTAVSAVLIQSGVTEDLVLSLMKELPDHAQPPVEISPDIRWLFPWEPLSIEGLRSLELAWRFSDREQLRPDDLLPMLLTSGSQARLILESLGALLDIVSAMPNRVRLFEGPGSSPKLSPEIRNVLEIARQAAGDSPLDTGHLLLGLAEIGHPLLIHLKQQIREALDGPL